MDNIQLSLDTSRRESGSSVSKTYCNIIANSGSLNVNDSNITEIIRNDSNVNFFAVNNISNASFSNTSITIDTSNLSSGYAPYSLRGISNTSGSIVFESGSITVDNKTVYGIYNDAGSITIGIPEDPSSQDYGRATADVSTTNPDIRAIGTSSGIGVKNANGGKVYYYDGKITGSTTAMPENPAGLEYMYEPKDYTDENGYQFRILEWMREQPGN